VTEAEAIADLARSAKRAPEIISVQGRTFLILDGIEYREISSADGAEPRPALLSQRVLLEDRSSFSAYLRAYGRPSETRVFASLATSEIVGELDYHQMGPADHTDPSLFAVPGRRRHRASWKLAHSEEWKRWTGASGKMMSQMEFARFLEENAPDVTVPAGADLLEIARDLYAVQKVDFRQAVRLDNQDLAFEWTTETEAKSKTTKGQVEVPTKFRLEIPVYYGESAVPIYAFLRYTLGDGALKLGFELHRAEHVRQAALQAIAHTIAEETGFPVHLGQAGG
jgi:hypothetical protein